MLIPEIDLELNPGTLGGRFTTLEGLLNQVYEELDEKVFAHGDAALPGATDHMAVFLANLKKVRQEIVTAEEWRKKKKLIAWLVSDRS